MKILRRIGIVVLLLLVIVFIGGSWYFSSKIIVYERPAERSEQFFAEWAPDWEVSPTETVEIQSGNNVIVADVYDNPEDAECAVITMHGLGGERTIARLYGPIFWDMGCDILSYDYAPANNDVFLTFGYYEKDDLSNVLDWLMQQTGLPLEKIGIIGNSYGAATALQALPEHPELGWVIADSAYANMEKIVRHQAVAQFGEWINLFATPAMFIAEQRANFDIQAVSPEDSVRGSDVPILLIHSQQDTYTPPENSEQIYAASNQETTRLVLTDWGAAHGRSRYVDPQGYASLVYEFLAEFAPDFGNPPEDTAETASS